MIPYCVRRSEHLQHLCRCLYAILEHALRSCTGRILQLATMSLNPKEISKLGILSRLHISETQQQATAEQLSGILDFVGQLSGQDTTGIEPLAHPLAVLDPVALRLRTDAVTETDQREANQANAPAVQNGLFLVPKVIE
jgi:aspartyl-tRNA(Asn)/glutamyl-tRNA(Gln) amidotransferase subunit C